MNTSRKIKLASHVARMGIELISTKLQSENVSIFAVAINVVSKCYTRFYFGLFG